MVDYYNYYRRAISLEKNGFKLVLGGTGLGKTSAIKTLVEKNEDARKFIYIANRVQLLNELAEKLPIKKISHQKSDFELLSKTDITPLLENHLFKRYSERTRKSKNPILISDIKRAYHTIAENRDRPVTGNFGEFISRQTSLVMNFIKRAIQHQYFNDEDHYESLIRHRTILSLFPYIDFISNNDRKVLLVTIQKAFRGFFDGQKQVSLFNLGTETNSNNIIFFDEFDFLENDLITLICEETNVPLPFDFVAQFYNAMENNKLPLPNYPADERIRQKIERVTGGIKNLQDKGIDYPNINHFVCTQDERIEADVERLKEQRKKTRTQAKKDEIKNRIDRLEANRIKGSSIFQTRYSIVKSRLFLDPNVRNGSFDLTKQDTGLSAFTLFRHVNAAVSNILHLFKELEDEYPTYYQEILRHCFEASDVFQRAIRTTRYTLSQKKVLTNYDFLHYNGYNLHEIQDLRQETDKNEIIFNHFSLNTTPEKILLNLAKNNFVFGLSATANIPRKLRNFDLGWLKEKLGDDYIDATVIEEDKQDISLLNKAKSGNRGNNIAFSLTRPLADESAHEQKLKSFIGLVARTEDEVFGDDTGDYRKTRVELFFSTLLQVITDAKKGNRELNTDTHLLFFSSFKQIEYVINQKTEDNEPLFTAQKQSTPNHLFDYYELRILETDFIVLFYDAAKGRSITNEERIKEKYYEIFWKDKPVFVVTTYPSAGNGINLQYYKQEGDFRVSEENTKVDFKSIHLLDSPYFFFAGIQHNQTIQEQNALIKKNIYYYTKLLASKTSLPEKTVEKEFKRHLENIRASYNPFNSIYLSSEDGVLNQLAVFIQAIGRIERVWVKMEDQHIYFREEVYKVFDQFCISNDFSKIKQNVLPYFSANMQSLIKQIEAYSREQHIEIDDWKEEHLAQINKSNQEQVGKLLSKIRFLNENKLTNSEAKEVRRVWNNLRLFGLRHQFDEALLDEYKAIFETEYHKNGKIRINRQRQIISPELVSHEYTTWKLNSIYNAISRNTIIKNYFDNRGYELAFGTNDTFFTPYFYQAILAGAIGEEAIKAIFKELDQIDTFEIIQQPIRPIPIASEEAIPNELFEVTDLKIKDRAYFIDCKNYSEQTLRDFQLSPSDPLWRPKLNEKYFKERAITKYQKIRSYYKGQSVKLIYINFMGSDIRTSSYLKVHDDTLVEVANFNEAEIIVIQGVLSRSQTTTYYNTYTLEFEKLLLHLTKDLTQ